MLKPDGGVSKEDIKILKDQVMQLGAGAGHGKERGDEREGKGSCRRVEGRMNTQLNQ